MLKLYNQRLPKSEGLRAEPSIVLVIVLVLGFSGGGAGYLVKKLEFRGEVRASSTITITSTIWGFESKGRRCDSRK
jgi:hypothetical protein